MKGVPVMDMASVEPTFEQAAENVGHGSCSHCGAPDTYVIEMVEEPITVGCNTVIVTVQADVCGVCGWRLFDETNMSKLQTARFRLEDGDTAGMMPVGTVYHA
jgi:hypothetical protein